MSEKRVIETVFKEAYDRLNAEQKKAVDAIEGPVMVIAGPGTGKTQILTLRIANILMRTDAKPENILALTFTNSGVRAMRERLRSYIGDEAYRVGIYTFHSFAEYVLQTYSSYFPQREFSKVVTELEKTKILESILQQQEFSEIVSTYDTYSSLKQVMGAIDDIKSEGLSPEAFEKLIPNWEKEQMEAESMFYKRAMGKHKAGDVKPTEKKKVEKRVAKAREIATVFNIYQRELQKNNLYDFSDMILSVLNELENNEHLKLDLQEQFLYVLVDEHQDTNEGQNRLIEFLTDAEHLDGHPNLFTVGDEKQSIYRFQGASDKTFAHFKSHYSDVEIIELEQNYRSSASILDASHHLIIHSLSDAKKLTSNQSDEKPIEVREFSDYKFELLFVAKDIESKLKADVAPNEIAVIYRSNKHLIELKTLFQQFQVPYQVLSRDTLFDDPTIIMLVNLIRVVADPFDNSSLAKVLFADFLKLDSIKVANTLREYRSLSRDKEGVSSLINLLEKDDYYKNLVALLSKLHTYNANHHFSETFKEAINASGFLTTLLGQADSRAGLRKVEVLFNEFRQQAERTASYQAKDFLEFVDATLSYNLNIEVTATQVGVGVQCMTAHGSKGLEFEHVYILNTTRNNWEKSRGFSSISLPINKYKGELDDERRLFYVALTRAKSHLAISSSKQDWHGKQMEPSQFISELAEEKISIESVSDFELQNESELLRFFSNESLKEPVFDVSYLAARFAEENISVTALNNYIDCPIKYLFRNLIQIPDVYTPALRYGDTIHRALEDFFRLSVQEKKILTKETLFDSYEKAMNTSGFFDKDYDVFMKKGRQSLGMYYDYYHKEWSVKVSLEEYVRRSVVIGDDEVTISGKIDKLEFLDEVGTGKVRVIDYKTGKVFSKKSTKAQKEALERQIQFYHLLLSGYKNGDIQVVDAVLDFVEPTEEGEFEKKTLSVTDKDIATLKDLIAKMVKEVNSGEFLTNGCQKKDCESCQFWETIHKK